MSFDLRPIVCEEGHVTRPLDAGSAFGADRITDRVEAAFRIEEKMVVGESKPVDVELIVHDVAHRLLMRAKQYEVDDLAVAAPGFSDKVGHVRIGGVYLPEYDPEAFGHDLHDLGVERDNVNVAQGDR